MGEHDRGGESGTTGWLESPVSHAYMLSFLPLEVNSVHSSYDHLSHWRAYGDNGCGCSFVITVPRDKLYEVNYDNAIRDATAAKLKRFLDTAAQVWDEVIRRKPASRYPRYEELLETVFATALKSRFLHKHPSYGLERERRAVVAAPEQSEIRTEVIGRNIRHHVRGALSRLSFGSGGKSGSQKRSAMMCTTERPMICDWWNRFQAVDASVTVRLESLTGSLRCGLQFENDLGSPYLRAMVSGSRGCGPGGSGRAGGRYRGCRSDRAANRGARSGRR